MLFLFMVSVGTTMYGQVNRILILGKITSDTTAVENVHIINKNSQKGTISNKNGEFQIPVTKNDTLIFSAIQFKYHELIITQALLNSKEIIIKLTNELTILDEVLVKQHNLSGYLQNDIENTSLKHHVDAFTLNLPNACKGPKNEVDVIRLRQGQYSGTIGQLYGWISGDLKNLKKLEKLETERLTLDKIRQFIKDAYFINELNIPKDHISHFLYYCKSRGVITLFEEDKKNEIVTILHEESKRYKK